MYEIADKYNVDGLKELVKENFDHACQYFWDDAQFAISARHAFSSTLESDKGLRDIICKTIVNHMRQLVDKPEIEALLTEFNGLAYGLLKSEIRDVWNLK